MAIYNTYFSVLGLQDSLGVLPNLGVLPGLGRLDDLGEYAFSPASLFLNGEQGVWYDPSDLTPEKVSWRRNLLTYSQDFENAAWTKSNASILSNLALYSQDFDNAWWLKARASITANTSVAPDGTTTADTLVEDTTTNSHPLYTPGLTLTANAYTMSAYVKASGRNKVRIAMAGAAFAGSPYANYDLVAVTATTFNGATSATITDAGNGWYRCVVTATATAGTGDFYLQPLDAANSASYTGSGAASLLFWGAQLVPGSTAQTYTRSLATAAPIQFADPLGGTLADKVVVAATTGQHWVGRNSATVSGTAGVTYTLSVYAKKDERSWFGVYFGGTGATGTATAYYNLDTGVVGTSSGGPLTASITDAGSGWYRCSVTAIASGGTLVPEFHPVVANGSLSNTGDGVSGIYVYGAQVEQASTASAYQRITDFSSDFLAAFPTHALYQESTGVTPVTALGQSVGYVFDKRLGPMGDNLFGYSSWQTIGGWEAVTNATLSVSNGQLVVHATGINAASGYRLTTVAGKQYQYRVRLAQDAMTGNTFMGVGSGGGSGFAANIASLNLGSTPGTYSITFTATSTDTRLTLFGSSGSVAGEILAWAEPMVREVPGNHAIQATSASRPTLQARSNLLERTEQFNTAPWLKQNTTVTENTSVAPDGTTTADLLYPTTTGSFRSVYQTGTTTVLTTATAKTISVYAKASGMSFIFIGDAFAGARNTWFNVSNGTVGTVAANHTASIESVGSGWYRCIVNTSIAWSASAVLGIGVSDADNSVTATTSGTNGVLLWGGQLEYSSTATTYQRVVTATDYADVGLPRNLTFDGVDDSLATAGNVDFATWTVGSRRNLLTVPTMFDDAGWTNVGSPTVTANSTMAPDGTTTADTITDSSAVESQARRQTIAIPGSTTTSYAASVYILKTVGAPTVFPICNLRMTGGTTVDAYIVLNTTTGETATFGAVSGSAVDVGSYWRVTLVAANNGTANTSLLYTVFPAGATTLTTTLNVAATGSQVFWGAQLEVGSTATAFQDVGTDKVTTFAGLFKNSNSSTQMVFETSANANSNNGTMYLTAQEGGTPQTMTFQSRGTIGAFASTAAVAYLAPTRRVITGLGAIESDNATLRIDGVQVNVATNDQGTGTFGSYLLYVGRRGGTTLPFNGGLFQLVIRGAATDSVTVGNAERWVGQLTGVAL